MRVKGFAVHLDPPETAVSGSKTESFCLGSRALKSHPPNIHYGYAKAEGVNTDLCLKTRKKWVHKLHT